ncbi:stomatin family protein [Alternaria alternata]|nr:stomatin family protein [Alternaria alternata]
MQLKVKPEEEQFQCEGVGRLEQERIVAEEAACAAEEEQACIEAEKVKVAQIATEEKESCCIAKKESKASPGWGMLGSGKKKESTKQRHEREAKEKKEREEQERLKPTTVIAEVAAVAVIIPAVREDSKVEVYPYAGLSESLAKKPKARLDQKAKLKEEEEATEARLREEEEAERRFPQEKAAAAEVETNRKKEDNIWVKWGALSVAKTKKKGKKTELIHLEEEERLGKEVEEEAERRKKVEEEAAAAAKPMILNSTSGLSWEKLVLDTDDWAAFGASTPSKKKKGKKGKTVEPVPPPPPDCPAESPTTFDDINQEEAVTTEIDMVLRDTGATKSGFRLSGLRNCTSGWGPSDKDTNAEGDNSWGSSDKTKKDDGFDFDFDTFKSPPAEKKPAGDDGWGGLRATTKTKKKSTKGVLIDDSVLKVPPPPPEPDKKEEDDSWGTFSFGGTAKGKKKKKKGVLGEEPPPPEPEPEPEPEAAVNELEPAKEENPWGCGWGAADAGTKKKKKGKKGELESNPEPVPEPKPEFKPPKMEVDSYSGLIKPQPKKLNATSDREAKLKKEEDTKRQKEVEEAVQVRRQEKEEAEQIRLEEEEVKVRKLEEEEAVVAVAAQTGVSSFDPAIETGAISKDDGCELRPEHLSRDDGWQNSRPCAKPNGHPGFELFVSHEARSSRNHGKHPIRFDHGPNLKPDTSGPSQGIPLHSNHILHACIKHYEHDQSTYEMPNEPEKRDLLGFTDVEAEHPKWYIRRLWLVAENDRKPFPVFLNPQVQELATQVNKVVNRFVKDEDMRHEELCGGAFLKKDAVHILDELGFGSRIWGDGSGAEIRLGSNLPGLRPRWGVYTDSGYQSNDEDSIRDNLRYWMAAQIQARINAPCKEKKSVPSVTAERMEQLPAAPTSVPASPSLPQWSEPMQRGGTPDTSSLEPSRLKRRKNSSAATVEAETKAGSNRSRSRARSDDSSGSVDTFSFTGFICTGPEADSPQARSDGYKRPRIDNSQCRSRSPSHQQSVEATSTVGGIPLTDTFTNVTIPDMIDNNNNNNNNNGGGEHSLFTSDRMRQKMQLDLTRFLANEIDFTGILREVVQPVRKFYTIRLNRRPYNDLNVDTIEFSRAFDHWESLIERDF